MQLPQAIPNKVDSAIIRLHSRRVTDMEFHPTNDNILISGDKVMSFLNKVFSSKYQVQYVKLKLQRRGITLHVMTKAT